LKKKKLIDVVAIIPARSGSKGIKNKNIKKIKNKPLIAWAIDICKKSKKIDYFFLLTDSLYYKKLAIKYGGNVPFHRPKSISKSSSTDLDFVKYSLKKLSEININPRILVNIRPTTPIRKHHVIDEAIKKFLKKINQYSALRSVEEMSETSYKTLIIENNIAKPIIRKYTMDEVNLSRQSFKKTYLPNGYIDIYKIDNIKKTKTLYGKKVLAFKTERTIEIDTNFDLKIAKKLV